MSPQARLLSLSLKRSLRPAGNRTRQITLGLAAGFGIATCTVLGAGVVYNDDVSPRPKGADEPLETVVVSPNSNEGMLAWAWGSNRYKVASSSAKTGSPIRVPAPLPHISGVALRDLALHEKHGACVDAAGNVYQWGDGFFSSKSNEERRPKLTLKGKNISDLAVTADKVYALSKRGTVYVLSSAEARQGEVKEQPSSWWTLTWLWKPESTVDHVELKPDSPLGRREKFTSLSAGRDHILALTSTGRAYTHAANSSANAYSQLGTQTISVRDPSNPDSEIPLALLPKATIDSLEQSTPFIRPASPVVPKVDADEADIRWCTKLYEIPSLRGVKAKGLVAGGRSSYLLTEDEGRVLAWGANEYGQLGLGANFTLRTVPIPTEVVLTRAYPGGTALKCLDISAGGDIVYFTVERKRISDDVAAVDILAAGMGQWGLLGTGLYNQVQGAPVKVKTVSGILEWNDASNALEALSPHAVSVSPTGHAVLTLDTLSSNDEGRDVLAWGQNSSYELGNGKRVAGALPGYVKAFRREPGNRMMVRETKREVKDLEGKLRGRNVPVQERIVAGWGCTAVYWKIV